MNYSGNDVVDRNLLPFIGFCNLVNSDYTQTFTVTKASLTNFPALDGQSVSYAFLQFPTRVINSPHTHPHSTELLLVFKGLVDYQSKDEPKQPSAAISFFGSGNASTVSVPLNVY
ncbi:hypothetical protein Patl1_37152 [Pistacia atlantica]|nr:hypothetical protein Patl1_37152 [Pistacia atlantica]